MVCKCGVRSKTGGLHVAMRRCLEDGIWGNSFAAVQGSALETLDQAFRMESLRLIDRF